jgi:hypothetical protein
VATDERFDPIVVSHEKIPIQYAHWKRVAQRLLDDLEGYK